MSDPLPTPDSRQQAAGIRGPAADAYRPRAYYWVAAVAGAGASFGARPSARIAGMQSITPMSAMPITEENSSTRSAP